jgi:hypothetical protein
MTATVVDFQARFPEFVQAEAATIQMFLDDAALIMNSPAKWLEYYDVAQMYRAAHFIAVAQYSATGDSGTLAPRSHQEVDDVVIKHAVKAVDPSFDDLLSTSYGKRFLFYRKICLSGFRGV